MTEVPITALLAGLLGLLFIALEAPIGVLRTRTNTSIHDGGNEQLAVALLAARITHPFGLDADVIRKPLRGIGALTTLIVTLIASGALVWSALAG